VASQFHLVSLSGMVVNILLIPFSSLTLISGYIFVATGLLFPPVAAVSGSVFEFLLASLNYAVSWTADVRFGFLMIPDLPAWFLPVYYVLLILSAAAARSVVRQCLRIVLMTLVVVQLWIVCQTPTVPELRCTILSVGHGNAVVVETGRRVIVVDAGAMNRGESAADIISRCLWNRGHRMIDVLVLSHPDADHYNAAPELLERMPVGRICISREFAASQAQEVQDLLARIESLQVPLSIVTHMDCLSDPATSDEAWSLRFMQHVADSSRDTADNEASLVVLLETPNATLCLPGDLEGDGQNGLIPLLEPCDLLVAPHHGSPAANTTELARKLKSPIVVLSAGDDRYLAHNQRIYRDRQILLTARDGAVTASFPAPEQMLIQTWANGLPSHWSRVSK
jgi:competence protein ComEC